MDASSWWNAVAVVTVGCTLSAPAVQAQDCARHMLTGAEFANDGLEGYPRVGMTWDPDGAGPLPEVAVIGGQFSIPALNIATWDGRQFAPIGEGLSGIVRALIVYDGRLIAGGEFTASGTGLPISRLAAWNGSSWEPFAGGADNHIYALHLHNGELYAAGQFGSIGGEAIPRLARWDGAQWHPVGDAPPMPLTAETLVWALETHQGDLYAGGTFESIGGVPAASIARWDGKAWSPLGSGVSPASCRVYTLLSSDLAGEPQLLVGGSFYYAGGQGHMGFARWNGTSWITPDTYLTGATGPLRFVRFGDRVIAAGSITHIIENGQPPVIRTNAFCVWDGQHWTPLDPGVTSGVGQALVVYNNELLLGGGNIDVGFFGSNESTVTGMGQWAGPGDIVRPLGDDVIVVRAATEFQGAIVAAGAFHFDDLRMITGLAQWDGARWRPFGSTPTPLFDVNNRPLLVADSESLLVNNFPFDFEGIPRDSIARWRDGVWTPMGDTFYGIAGLATGGDFFLAGRGLARWDGAAWQAVAPPLTSDVYSVVAFGPDIILGGAFLTPIPGVVRWDPATLSWTPINLPGGSIGVERLVKTVATFNDQLIIGGTFSTAFGHACHALIIWDGAQWLPFDLTGTVDASAVAPEGVYLRGSFEVPGHPGFSNLALWNGSSLEPVTIDNPSTPATLSQFGAFVANRGEVVLFQETTTAADGRTAYGWTRITRAGGDPALAQQPQSGASTTGDTVVLSVSVPSGYDPLTFQWHKNAKSISDGPGGAGGSGIVSGSATDTLTTTNVSIADAGAFTVLVSNECGDVLSDPAAVGVFCRADFNHSGVVNSTDVSDFINAWFQDQVDDTLVTDFNHDGVVNSTDVSDFINQWFEDSALGCG